MAKVRCCCGVAASGKGDHSGYLSSENNGHMQELGLIFFCGSHAHGAMFGFRCLCKVMTKAC